MSGENVYLLGYKMVMQCIRLTDSTYSVSITSASQLDCAHIHRIQREGCETEGYFQRIQPIARIIDDKDKRLYNEPLKLYQTAT